MSNSNNEVKLPIYAEDDSDLARKGVDSMIQPILALDPQKVWPGEFDLSTSPFLACSSNTCFPFSRWFW